MGHFLYSLKKACRSSCRRISASTSMHVRGCDGGVALLAFLHNTSHTPLPPHLHLLIGALIFRNHMNQQFVVRAPLQVSNGTSGGAKLGLELHRNYQT
eukprot:1133829-Pelagomonas_calceolata.AAC.1